MTIAPEILDEMKREEEIRSTCGELAQAIARMEWCDQNAPELQALSLHRIAIALEKIAEKKS